MMRTAFHNNHHKNPSHSNFGFQRYEFDLTYFIIRILNRLKVVYINKPVSDYY